LIFEGYDLFEPEPQSRRPARSYSMKNKSKILALILLPFVLYGLYYVYTQSRVNVIHADDPLFITYNGGSPPDPMFVVSNMFPGDEVPEKVFNVKVTGSDSQDVEMTAFKTAEEKNFAEILDIEIVEMSLSSTVFSGKLQDLFDLPPISLGTFSPGTDKNFRVKVKFPADAGNDYQEAKVVFDIIWRSQLPPVEIPEECKLIAGKITNVIEGTEGNDNIDGSPASELILAKGGRDRVDADNGDDCVVGAEGNDRELDGGEGNDVVIGGNGNDDMEGGSGNDLMYGNDGNDKMDGGSGDDLIYGGAGNDKIDAGSENDKIWGGIGEDKIKGAAGNDEIYGEEDNDLLSGGAGNDKMYGGTGNDNMSGESGDDEMYGQEGNDEMEGDSGNDYLDGGTDHDVLKGNAGTDTCVAGETVTSCEL